MDDSVTFGHWVRKHRHAADLTQAQLAEGVGCARITIRKLESDQVRPSKSMAERLALQLGVALPDRESFLRFARGVARDEAIWPDRLSARPPGDESAASKHNLPNPATTLIGREREIELIRERILESRGRLFTLVGPPGVGKTRVAIAVAAGLADDFTDGVSFTSLAPVSDPVLVASAVARQLGLRDIPGWTVEEVVVESLKGKHILLVLDNCEHLVDACVELVEVILQACPHVQILATSRQDLQTDWEARLRVPPLGLPRDDVDLDEREPLSNLMVYPATRLFIERAASSGVVLTSAAAPVVVRICHDLDGLPLAIELAASRTDALSPAQIHERLQDHRRLLGRRSRSGPQRHDSLYDALEWSHGLLSKSEQFFFRRLAVFAGSWSLEAAEYICAGAVATGFSELDVSSLFVDGGTVVDLILALVAKSLVVAEIHEETMRYRLLDTMRRFAQEKLVRSEEDPVIGERHARFFLDLAEEAETALRGPRQVFWLHRLDQEHNNIRLALTWLRDHGPVESALRMVGALSWFWLIRGHYSEGRSHLAELLGEADDDQASPARPLALYGAALLAVRQESSASVRLQFARSLAAAETVGNETLVGRSLTGLAFWANFNQDPSLAKDVWQWAREGLARSQRIGDRWNVAWTLLNLGYRAKLDDDLVDARRYAVECLDAFREVGDTWGIAWALRLTGEIALNQAKFGEAQVAFDEQIVLSHELGDLQSVGSGLIFLGLGAHRQDELRVARGRYEEAARIYRDLGAPAGLALAVANLGDVYLREGDIAQARQLAQESLLIGRNAAPFYSVVGLQVFSEVSLADGDVEGAKTYAAEALKRLRGDSASRTVEFFEYTARLALADSDVRQALALTAAASALRRQAGYLLPSEQIEPLNRMLQVARRSVSPVEQEAIWAEGSKMDLEQTNAFALAGLTNLHADY